MDIKKKKKKKTDEADARLVSNFFLQAASNEQCTLDVFEEGFMPMAGRPDKFAINFPKAYYYMAMMLKGAGFENEPGPALGYSYYSKYVIVCNSI
jgi:translation initiation factor 4G